MHLAKKCSAGSTVNRTYWPQYSTQIKENWTFKGQGHESIGNGILHSGLSYGSKILGVRCIILETILNNFLKLLKR